MTWNRKAMFCCRKIPLIKVAIVHTFPSIPNSEHVHLSCQGLERQGRKRWRKLKSVKLSRSTIRRRLYSWKRECGPSKQLLLPPNWKGRLLVLLPPLNPGIKCAGIDIWKCGKLALYRDWSKAGVSELLLFQAQAHENIISSHFEKKLVWKILTILVWIDLR